MTEDEAKTRWCPMVRLMFNQQGGGANRWITKNPGGEVEATQLNPGGTWCIGSACMMWRWEQVELLAPDGQGWADEEPQLEPSKVHGYCGLAGNP